MPELLDVAIGAAIRLRRMELGLSQGSLADACGITFQQIQKYERGANRISFSMLVKVAHALDCRIQNLVGEMDSAEGIEPGQAEALQLVATPGAPNLLRAYAELPENCRLPIIQLLRDLAGETGAIRLVAMTVDRDKRHT